MSTRPDALEDLSHPEDLGQPPDLTETTPDDLSEDTRSPDTAEDLADLAGPDVPGPDPDVAPPPRCTWGEVDILPLPEASGAVPLDDTHALIVADSGNLGRALIHSAAASTPFTLPLGEGAGDDVEGLARAPGGLVYGLTSAGYLRAWRVEVGAAGWEAALVFGPAPVGEQGIWVGGPQGVNTGGNFEGLCLHPAPPSGACAGWAGSKRTGELVCLRATEGLAFVLDPTVRVPVFDPEQLSDCAYEDSPPHRLFVAGNIYSGDHLVEVRLEGEGPLELPPIELSEGQRGAPNQEAIFVRGRAGALELFSFGDLQDLAGDKSPWTVLSCAP